MTQQQPTALFFVYVWPEPRSSAAGVRTRELMRALQERGWLVTAASPSGDSVYRAELEAAGIKTLSCDPNISSATDALLGAVSPSLVIYDRFVMEEQFGWRARALWPAALHLVDTQDLHSVRRAREKLAASGGPWEKVLAPSPREMGEDLLRELSSLYRADGAFVVSAWERNFLIGLGFPAQGILHLPFPGEADEHPAPFTARNGFCFLGNFRHPPNMDSLRWTFEIWPTVRARLPSAELHLYGAYPPAEISRHKGKDGIFAHGPVRDHRAALRQHRVLLAPLRFGAGIKGKVIEAWGTGTPAIGTSLTFEGMGYSGPSCDTPSAIAEAAATFHEDESAWRAEQSQGLECVRDLYSREKLAGVFLGFVAETAAQVTRLREENLTGKMLRHHQSNSTKYFSRWIEAKNQK